MTRTLIRTLFLSLLAILVGLYAFHVSPAARASVIPSHSPIGTASVGGHVMLPHPHGECIQLRRIVLHYPQHRVIYVCTLRVWQPIHRDGAVIL